MKCSCCNLDIPKGHPAESGPLLNAFFGINDFMDSMKRTEKYQAKSLEDLNWLQKQVAKEPHVRS